MRNRGFTLVEVLVAMAVLCTAALGGMQLIVIATETMARARAQALAASLASARIEQLRGLRLAFDESGQRVTDLATNLATEPAGTGGAGLTPSGGATLDANVPGFVDYLDGAGQWLATGAAVPAGTAFVRRWSIDRVDASEDLLVLQVLVRPASAASAPAARRVNGEARFVTLRARARR
jgi:prepilin-type N-terminal cleavage/methylation domain-containing protein